MSKNRFQSVYSNGREIVKLALTTYHWSADEIYFVYSPSLDITGYGRSEEEARKSFEITLGEFVTYTKNKGTIFEELEHLGWAVNKRKKKIHAPDLSELLDDNEEFRDLYEKGIVTEQTRDIELELA